MQEHKKTFFMLFCDGTLCFVSICLFCLFLYGLRLLDWNRLPRRSKALQYHSNAKTKCQNAGTGSKICTKIAGMQVAAAHWAVTLAKHYFISGSGFLWFVSKMSNRDEKSAYLICTAFRLCCIASCCVLSCRVVLCCVVLCLVLRCAVLCL